MHARAWKRVVPIDGRGTDRTKEQCPSPEGSWEQFRGTLDNDGSQRLGARGCHRRQWMWNEHTNEIFGSHQIAILHDRQSTIANRKPQIANRKCVSKCARITDAVLFWYNQFNKMAIYLSSIGVVRRFRVRWSKEWSAMRLEDDRESLMASVFNQRTS